MGWIHPWYYPDVAESRGYHCPHRNLYQMNTCSCMMKPCACIDGSSECSANGQPVLTGCFHWNDHSAIVESQKWENDTYQLVYCQCHWWQNGECPVGRYCCVCNIPVLGKSPRDPSGRKCPHAHRKPKFEEMGTIKDAFMKYEEIG